MAPSRGLRSLPSLLRPSPPNHICPQCRPRHLSHTPPLPSGHNRWSKIKHDKLRTDLARNKANSIFSSEITTASKLHGPNPTLNTRLADLITKATRAGFAKTSIEAAIARGQGRSTNGAMLESVVVEGLLPGNVGVIVECETDSKLRTLADVRLRLKEAGGSATPSVYLFNKIGRVVFEAKEGVGVEEALEAALEAGATDVDEDEEGRLVVSTEPGDTMIVGEAMQKALGLQVATSEIAWEPNEDTRVALSDEQAAVELTSFVDEVHDKEATVQAIAMNVAQGSLEDGVWKDLQSRLSS